MAWWDDLFGGGNSAPKTSGSSGGITAGSGGGGGGGGGTAKKVVAKAATDSSIPKAPSGAGASGLNSAPVVAGGGGGGGGGGGVDSAATAESKAKAAGKSQSAAENANTQRIIDALLGSLAGYASGRDTQLKNAETSLNATIEGILANYTNAVADYNKTGIANEQDEASKSAANVTNRARERMSLLEQAASQGAGETDQLRAQLQAFNNFDANQLETTRSFFDTQRSVNSQIEGANSQSEASRRSAWQQNQEAVGNAYDTYNKNYSDVWTNIQRTAAANSNIDSDYSTGFVADYRGNDPVNEASRLAGQAYRAQEKDETWYKTWSGKDSGRDTQTTSTNRAGTATIKAPKAAEGATLRGKW